MTRFRRAAAAPLLALLAASTAGACRTATQPAAAPAPVATAASPSAQPTARADTGRGRSDADVRFLQGMIGHHAQAIEMTALVPSRTQRPEVRLLAERIDVSQRDEIKSMRDWLTAHGAAVPDATAGHDAHAGHAMPGMAASDAMPGMATPEQMAQLAAATGVAFDRLFLQLMIRHHEGALVMVRTLFASPGAGQDADVFRLASEVDGDQRMEIVRMRALLATLTLPNR